MSEVKSVFLMRGLSYWFNNSKREGAFLGMAVLQDSIVVVDFKKYSDRKVMMDSCESSTVLGMAMYHEGRWTSAQVAQLLLENGEKVWGRLEDGKVVERDNGYLSGEWTEREDVAKAVRTRHQQKMAYAQMLSTSPIQQLEAMLKGRDWFAAYSDAPGVCLGWERQWERCCEVAQQCDLQEAINLYHKHAPEGRTCPWPLKKWSDAA